ncbi:tetratricopeptide repeat protein [Listeria rustica]|uniref:Tetratricopeptide repeat protein n=1 Tax=Listeria rustica TaxID=2713503 RepID=A0A7W1YEM8_9LIST|nr:tetratricopeptide repeat protein [Listeria rustica]MBA3924706.1 tetratricopeptide repeat protein [Listeria rustica]
MMKTAEILALLENGHYQDAKESAKKALLSEPENALLNYYAAWSCDGLSDETEAISYYEKALEIGLPEDDLADAYIGLGSTYRAIGNYEKANETFQKARVAFPENRAITVFASMALYNEKHYKEAMQLAIKIIGETSNDPTIIAYKKAIINYSEDLDAVWD